MYSGLRRIKNKSDSYSLILLLLIKVHKVVNGLRENIKSWVLSVKHGLELKIK